MTDVKGVTLGDLLGRLHRAITDFIHTMDETIASNRSVDSSEIKTLREHIRERLSRNENIDDNQKMLMVLDLFASNSAVIELVRLDADDWLRFIEDIEKGLEQKAQSGSLTDEELVQVKEMQRLASEVKTIIRK